MSEAFANTAFFPRASFLVGLSFLTAGYFSLLSRQTQNEIHSLLFAVGSLLIATTVLSKSFSGITKNEHNISQMLIFLAVVGCLAIADYPTAALVSVILVTGKYLQQRSVIGIRDSVNPLLRISNISARKVVGEYVQKIDADLLQPGDYVEVLPGDIVPADAVVASGSSKFDESFITGEFIPVEASEGRNVFAGSTNLSNLVILQVSKGFKGSLIHQIFKTVQTTQHVKPPSISGLEEIYAKYYLPVAIGISALTSFLTGDPERGVAVLISSLPCAILLVAPTVNFAALSALAKRGVFVKNAKALQACADLKCVVFDKTAAMTYRELDIVEVSTPDAGSEQKVFQIAASLGRYSSHPYAKAVFEKSKKLNLETLEVTEIFENSTKGICGNIGGKYVIIGYPSWLQELGVSLKQFSSTRTETISVMAVAIDNIHKANIYLAERNIPGASQIITQLAKLGIQKIVFVRTDKNTFEGELSDRIVDTDNITEILSDDNIQRLASFRYKFNCLMVIRDGVNNSAMTDSANINIAVTNLNNINNEIPSSDVIILAEKMDRILILIKTIKKIQTTIICNLTIGLAFVIFSCLLSTINVLIPLSAAFFHQVGVFFVIINSARLINHTANKNFKTLNE